MPILYMLNQFLEVPVNIVWTDFGVLAGTLMPSSKQDQSIQLSGPPGLCINRDQVDNICTDCSNLGVKIMWNLTGTTTKAQARACIHGKQLGLIGGSYLRCIIILEIYFYLVFLYQQREQERQWNAAPPHIWFENCLIWLTSHTHTHTHYARKNHSCMF